MNICGCLVHVAPDAAKTAQEAMLGFDGVEIHATAEDGRVVVVVEDTPEKLASETIMDLHQIPGVISLTLTYHHFEDLAETRPHLNASCQT
ncbi:chaperone NapD [Ruegeria profundi]|uniref:chaperone NapD n=1 Tax=Ruegeria profundi TaxID=1685378 RepID=UPI003C7EB88F